MSLSAGSPYHLMASDLVLAIEEMCCHYAALYSDEPAGSADAPRTNLKVAILAIFNEMDDIKDSINDR